jgi:hypothetical protein
MGKPMTEGRERFIQKLEDAADRIGDIQRHELQILLRRAALRLRNIDRPPLPDDDKWIPVVDPKWGGDDPGAA